MDSIIYVEIDSLCLDHRVFITYIHVSENSTTSMSQSIKIYKKKIPTVFERIPELKQHYLPSQTQFGQNL